MYGSDNIGGSEFVFLFQIFHGTDLTMTILNSQTAQGNRRRFLRP
jgi:hypothetical protein